MAYALRVMEVKAAQKKKDDLYWFPDSRRAIRHPLEKKIRLLIQEHLGIDVSKDGLEVYVIPRKDWKAQKGKIQGIYRNGSNQIFLIEGQVWKAILHEMIHWALHQRLHMKNINTSLSEGITEALTLEMEKTTLSGPAEPFEYKKEVLKAISLAEKIGYKSVIDMIRDALASKQELSNFLSSKGVQNEVWASEFA